MSGELMGAGVSCVGSAVDPGAGVFATLTGPTLGDFAIPSTLGEAMLGGFLIPDTGPKLFAILLSYAAELIPVVGTYPPP